MVSLMNMMNNVQATMSSLEILWRVDVNHFAMQIYQRFATLFTCTLRVSSYSTMESWLYDYSTEN